MRIKKPILLDSIYLTLFVFLFIAAVTALFPINLKVFHPIKDAFADFDYTDFYFGKLKKMPDVSNDIVVVNIGHLSRAEIAAQLEVIKMGHPKAIGLDAIFYEEKEPIGDSLLQQAIQSSHNLVGIFKRTDSSEVYGHPKFRAQEMGYANLYGSEVPEKVVRYFSPAYFGKPMDWSFAAKLASFKDSTYSPMASFFSPQILKINYRHQASFITLSPYDLFRPSFDPSIFNDKIVMMGYTGIPGDSTDMEDQHFTPMNHKMAGRSLPDMKGIYIHACIVQSLLDRTYIKGAPLWLEVLLTTFVTFLTAWLMIFFYVHKARWFHLTAKIVQLLAGVVFLFISIWIMHVYHININFTILFVCLVLCADLVYFYDPFAKWLHKKNWFHSEILKH